MSTQGAWRAAADKLATTEARMTEVLDELKLTGLRVAGWRAVWGAHHQPTVEVPIKSLTQDDLRR